MGDTRGIFLTTSEYDPYPSHGNDDTLFVEKIRLFWKVCKGGHGSEE